jgi:elongation factor Ts
MVKELRDKTGAGMMDCKKALAETNGDIEAAVDWLRAKGIATAGKKAGRVAAEGLIGIAAKGGVAVMVEVNSETDFVARNTDFQALVKGVAEAALGTDGSVAQINAAAFPGSGRTVEAEIKDKIATIGENMTLRRAAVVKVPDGVVAHYVHSSVAPNLGKIGVLVGLSSPGKADPLHQFGRQVAMHIAAAKPLAVRSGDLDPALVEREKSVYREQSKESGKPEAIVEKMVEGRMRKFFEGVTLLAQPFVHDTEKTVEKAAKDAEKEVGGPVDITQFVMFQVGEGVEKAEGGDFASEVAAMAGTK